jgi:hypothetical protein
VSHEHVVAGLTAALRASRLDSSQTLLRPFAPVPAGTGAGGPGAVGSSVDPGPRARGTAAAVRRGCHGTAGGAARRRVRPTWRLMFRTALPVVAQSGARCRRRRNMGARDSPPDTPMSTSPWNIAVQQGAGLTVIRANSRPPKSVARQDAVLLITHWKRPGTAPPPRSPRRPARPRRLPRGRVHDAGEAVSAIDAQDARGLHAAPGRPGGSKGRERAEPSSTFTGAIAQKDGHRDPKTQIRRCKLG